MKTASAKVAMRGDASWPAPNSSKETRQSDLPRENFDSVPHPFAIMLGATTMLLLITTLRSLWLLIS